MKRIFILTVLILSCICATVNANSIHSINMDIYVDNSGDASIIETWKCQTTQGTESYHPYYNLGNSQIQNLKVSDEDGEYETLEEWNVNDDFYGKSNKCGLNEISDGVEICWGISEYGSKTYKVEYQITNFVSQLNDAQMAYWTLIPHDFSDEIGKVDITIRSDFKYEDTLDVWGYGNYGGLCYVADGVIKMISEDALNSSEYMTILVKYPQNTFNVTNTIEGNFEYYLNMAQEGAIIYEGETDEPTLFDTILGFIFVALLGVGAYSAIKSLNHVSKEDREKIKNAEYYRDIPCGKDIFKAFYIANYYGLMKNKSDIMGAILLKWLKENRISIDKRERGLFKKEETCVIFGEETATINFANDDERKLYDMMQKASGDGILEKRELERWCSNKHNVLFNWFDNSLENEKKKLIEEGEIEVIKNQKLFGIKSYVLKESLLNEAVNLSGLKKFLKDYSLIYEREAIEVALFEDYLIYAQLLGIADKVMKQFKELYPEIVEVSNYNSFDNVNFVMVCASSGISSARAAANAYSAGGGGFSSGGGGGGSFGGGSGGGGFR